MAHFKLLFKLTFYFYRKYNTDSNISYFIVYLLSLQQKNLIETNVIVSFDMIKFLIINKEQKRENQPINLFFL